MTRQRLRHLTTLGLRDYLTENPQVLGPRISKEERHILQDPQFWETLDSIVQRRWLTKELLWSLDSLSYGFVLERPHAVKLPPEICDHLPRYSPYSPRHIIESGPQAEGFWFQAIAQAALQEPDGDFSKALAAKYREDLPQEWEHAAGKILNLLDDIWRSVREMCVSESTFYHFCWEQGEKDALRGAVWRGLIQEEWVGRAISELQWRQVIGKTKDERDNATEILKQIGKALWEKQSGSHKNLTEQDERAIVADCENWRRICKALNKEFKKKEWKEKKHEVSELNRKEMRGSLAEQYSIPVADVEAIEWLLEQPSGRSKKSTPTKAMYHIIARKHFVGEKTVANIWENYLKVHPEKSGKKGKTSTTLVVERIA